MSVELIAEAERRVDECQRQRDWSRQQAEIFQRQAQVDQHILETEEARLRLLRKKINLESRRLLLTRVHDNDPTLKPIDLKQDGFLAHDGNGADFNELLFLFKALRHNHYVESLDMGSWFSFGRTVDELQQVLFLLHPSMRSLLAINIYDLSAQAHLDSFFRGVQSHGNITRALIHFTDPEVSLEFKRRHLIGLQELDLELDFTEGEWDNTSVVIESFQSLSTALRENQMIQNVSLSVTCAPSIESFQAFTQAIVTMPNLEVVTFKYSDWMPREEDEDVTLELEPDGHRHEQLLVQAIQQSPLLRQVKFVPNEDPAVDESRAAINDTLQYHLEMKKIDFQTLVAADDDTVPLALWPFILAGSPANRRRADVRFRLLCEKPELCNEANTRADE